MTIGYSSDRKLTTPFLSTNSDNSLWSRTVYPDDFLKKNLYLAVSNTSQPQKFIIFSPKLGPPPVFSLSLIATVSYSTQLFKPDTSRSSLMLFPHHLQPSHYGISLILALNLFQLHHFISTTTTLIQLPLSFIGTILNWLSLTTSYTFSVCHPSASSMETLSQLFYTPNDSVISYWS